MRSYYITFRSVTFAQRGERFLTARGYRVTLQRTPRWMEEQGCGYCLKLRTEEITLVVLALRNARIPMRKVYQQRSDGKMEEVTL